MSRSWDIVGVDWISGVSCTTPYERVDKTNSDWDLNTEGRREAFHNHNYAVDHASLPEGVEVAHINLNDGSCAGLAYPALNLMALQYHPDSVFGEFIELTNA